MMPVVRRRLPMPKKLAKETNLLFATLAARTRPGRGGRGAVPQLCSAARTADAWRAEVYAGLMQVLLMQPQVRGGRRGVQDGAGEGGGDQPRPLLPSICRAPTPASAKTTKAVGRGRRRRQHRQRQDAALLPAQPRHVLSPSAAPKSKDGRRSARRCSRSIIKPADVRDIRYALSGVYSTLGDQAHSEEQLKLILDADPNDATACNDLGYLWADQNKNLAEAEKLIRKAMELDRQQRTRGAGRAARRRPGQRRLCGQPRLGAVPPGPSSPRPARSWSGRSALPGGADDPGRLGPPGRRLFPPGDKKAAGEAWKKALELYETGVRRQPDEAGRGHEGETSAPGP